MRLIRLRLQRYDKFPKHPKIFEIFIRLSQYVKERLSERKCKLVCNFPSAEFFEAKPQRTREAKYYQFDSVSPCCC